MDVWVRDGDGEILEEWRMERPGKSRGSSMTTRKREPWVDFEFLMGIQALTNLSEIQENWEIEPFVLCSAVCKKYDEERKDGASEAKMRKRPNSDPSSL